MRTIAIVNQKGGCGKTTTAINLAGVLARLGQPTLLIDLDPQAHCAAGLAIPEDRIDLTIADAMLAPPERELDESRLLWRISKGFDLAPCTMRLAGLEAAKGGLAELPDKEARLAHAIDRLTRGESGRKYAWCVIDCPPSIGLLTFNALRAATEALIPVETGFFAYRGAARQIGTIKALVKRMGTERPHRLLATMHDPESAIAKALLAEMGRKFANDLVPTVIRLDQKLRESASLGQPVVEYAPDSTGAEDYGALASWLIDNPPKHQPAEEPLEAPRAIVHAPPGAGAGGVGGAVVEARPPSDTLATHDGLMTRAAELAARVRALTLRSDAMQSKFAADEDALGRRLGRTSVNGSNGSNGSNGDAHAHPHAVAAQSPTVTPKGVRFVCLAHRDAKVFVAGDFNKWSPTAAPLRFDERLGMFEATIDASVLPPGRHAYRLIIDGQWRTDPLNPETQENGFGERDSVLFIRPDAPAPREQTVVIAERAEPVLH